MFNPCRDHVVYPSHCQDPSYIGSSVLFHSAAQLLAARSVRAEIISTSLHDSSCGFVHNEPRISATFSEFYFKLDVRMSKSTLLRFYPLLQPLGNNLL